MLHTVHRDEYFAHKLNETIQRYLPVWTCYHVILLCIKWFILLSCIHVPEHIAYNVNVTAVAVHYEKQWSVDVLIRHTVKNDWILFLIVLVTKSCWFWVITHTINFLLLFISWPGGALFAGVLRRRLLRAMMFHPKSGGLISMLRMLKRSSVRKSVNPAKESTRWPLRMTIEDNSNCAIRKYSCCLQ